MTVNERFEEIIKKLYSGNKRAFSQAIGVAPTVIENIVGKRQGNPSFEVTQKVLFANENINANWLITGIGNMLIGKGENKQYAEFSEEASIVAEPELSLYKLKTDYHGVERQSIPLYEIDAAAGLSLLFSSQNTQIPLDYITVPNAPKCDGAVSVRGDSMYPILKAGDIVCYKTITSIDNIVYGEMYLLDIDNGDDQYLTVKFLQKSDRGDDFVTLASENRYHARKDIAVSQIRALAIIKLSIRYNTIS